MHKMTKKPPVEIKEIGDEVFVLVEWRQSSNAWSSGFSPGRDMGSDRAGVERCHASLDDGDAIEISYNGTQIH
jgi:hypothetical protein